MAQVDRQTVLSALEEMGLDEDVLDESYRGKGETREGFGLVVTDSGFMNEFIAEMAGLDLEAGRELARRGKRDALGKRFILYFPGCELE